MTIQVKYKKVDASDIEVQKTIRWMDAEVFPDDKPVYFYGSTWFVGYVGNEPACYAAWRPHVLMETVNELHHKEVWGFLYRAGVLRQFRGNRCQPALIKLREDDMLAQGIKTSVTYTETYSIESMRSMISAGYKPYKANVATNLSGYGRAAAFVHWRKDLA
jgi:hypothetical protein